MPNWVALHSGIRAEVHGLLGNRGAAAQVRAVGGIGRG